ncbi:hypothetical protein PENSPDRAFT_755838 [Peniophora sp. CONT]|nr:hypothetical protein PENSPDRAFT_755838 [Peniophora sp. CONT]
MASLDEELRLMDDPETHASARARRLRNMTITACRLPVELLTTIFAFVKDDWRPSESLHERRYDLRWIQVTYVCSHWRSIALSKPTLWSSFDGYQIPPQFSALILARSQSLSIDLSWNSEYLDYEVCSKTLGDMEGWILSEPILQRTRKLAVHIADFDELDLIQDWSAANIPLLEELRLELSREIYDLNPVEWQNLLLPQLFLVTDGEVPPALSHISLCSIMPEWGSPLLSQTNLTHLSLAFSSDLLPIFQRIPTLQQFIDILARMTGLRSLHLDAFFPEDQNNNNIQLRLPDCFEQLNFVVPERHENDNVAMNCLFLYNHLTIPSTAQQSLHLGPSEFPLNAMNRAMPAYTVRRLFTVSDGDSERTRMTSLELHGLSIVARYTTTTALGAATFLSSREFAAHEASGLYGQMSESVYDTPLFTSGNSSMLASVESISFHYMSSVFGAISPDPTWLRREILYTLKDATKTQRVTIPYNFSHALLQLLALRDSDGLTLAFWPALRTVTFEIRHVPGLWGLGSGTDCSEEDVANMLRARRDCGAPIDRFRVEKELRTKDIWARVEDLVEIEFV